MDIKKMAELVVAKVREVEAAGIFDELANAAEETEKPTADNAEKSEVKGDKERDCT